MAVVRFIRVSEIDGDLAAAWKLEGDTVTVLVRDDLYTEEVAAVAEEMWCDILTAFDRPHPVLRVIHGGYSPPISSEPTPLRAVQGGA